MHYSKLENYNAISENKPKFITAGKVSIIKVKTPTLESIGVFVIKTL